MRLRHTVLFCFVCFIFLSCQNKPTDVTDNKVAVSPAAVLRPPANPLKNAYFGDLHLHTSYSMDAFVFATRTTPEDSFRYAMGETVEYRGKRERRLVPLDFLAVTDHAEYLGAVREAINPNGPFANTEWEKTLTNPDPKVAAQAFMKLIGSTKSNKPLPEFTDPKVLRSAWETYAAMADKYYKPGNHGNQVGGGRTSYGA